MDESDSEGELVLATHDDDYSASDQDDETDERRRDHIDHMAKIEQEFADLKDRLYQEKVAALDAELQRLAEGVHEQYVQQVLELELQREQRVATAELFRRHQLDALQAHASFDRRLADHEFQVGKQELRANMLTSLEERRRRLQHVRTQNERLEAELGDDIRQRLKVGGRARKKERVEDRPDRKRRLQAIPWPYIIYQLRDSEIADDLAALSKKVAAKTTKRHAQKEGGDKGLEVEVVVRDGRLQCGGRLFERGAAIYVESRETGRYAGAVTAVNATEVWVRRADGSKTKLYVSQLRLGRYSIRSRRDGP